MQFHSKVQAITGLSIPVSALRTLESEGIGDFLDLIPFAQFVKKSGATLIQLLPVNDSGLQSSPYSSLSAFALHPVYIHLSALPESKGFVNQIKDLKKRFDSAERIPYDIIVCEKLALLRAMYDKNKDAIIKSAACKKFIESNTWLREYAAYSLLKSKNNNAHWQFWPEFVNPSFSDIEKIWADKKNTEDLYFYVWMQKAAEEQFVLAGTALSEIGVELKGDLPILMNDDSADVWAKRNFFKRDRTAGAPPDMFASLGQNWGFPVYDWDALKEDAYSFWIDRLKQADKFYSAFRIDHVLGFFRIWSLSSHDYSGYLGNFLPSVGISRRDLVALGFDSSRIRWLSEPHIRSSSLYEALYGEDNIEAKVKDVETVALERIGNEDIFLFKKAIRGEKDIDALSIVPKAKEFLSSAWRNRVLLECEPDTFVPTWSYWDTTAFPTLSHVEKNALEALFAHTRSEAEFLWEKNGKELIAMMTSATKMLPCAEDLGAVPACVPKVLFELGVLGLRIVRWARNWSQAGEPYIKLSDYPYLSVCTPSCHDTSTLREWWNTEAGKYEFWNFLGGKGNCPEQYTSETAAFVLGELAKGNSRILMLQLQDALALSPKYYNVKAEDERINVPGSWNHINWTYRMRVTIEELLDDDDLITRIKNVCALRLNTQDTKREILG